MSQISAPLFMVGMLSLMLAIPGCTDFVTKPAPLNSRVVFFDEASETELSNFKPDRISLWFPLISGHLRGNPNKEFVSLPVGPKYRFVIDLKEKEDLIRQLATPLREEEGLPKLTIAPAGVKIARLATFSLDAQTRQGLGTTAWRDLKTKEPLMLAYFSQSCHVTAVLQDGDDEYRIDVKIDQGGYHWLRRSQVSEKQFIIKETPFPENVVLAVVPNDRWIGSGGRFKRFWPTDAVDQTVLGGIYYQGQGGAKNYQEAAKWFRRAAEQGYAEAQYNLGRMYDYGQGVPQDQQEAVRWYRLAADQGLAAAQHNLGGKYYQGKGVLQNYPEAVKWFRLAAGQGLSDSQYNLGVMYLKGQGMPKDFQEAVKWFRLAADQGFVGAQYNLGEMYYEGRGVPKDYVLAYMWLDLAATQDKTFAEPRDRIKENLTPQQLSEAEQLAREWKVKGK